MPVVKMPDGQLVDMPDNPSPEQLAGLQKLNSPSIVDQGIHYAKLGGSALMRGLASIPAMAATAGLALNDRPSRRRPDVPISGPLADVAAMGTQPKTTGEKYASSVLEAVGGAAGPGMITGPVKALVPAIASGLGSEGAAQATGDNPLARILGGLGGGLAGGLATAAKTSRADLAREATRDASPAELLKAQTVMKQAETENIPINLSQAMARPSNVDTMVETLASNKNGKEVARQLRNQPTDVSMAVERELTGLPGVAREPQHIANNVQEAATGTLNTLKRERTDLWQNTFDKEAQKLRAANPGTDVSQVPARAISSEITRLRDVAAQTPNTPKFTLLNDLADSLELAPGKPLQDVNQINEVLKAAGAKLKGVNLSTPGIDAGTSKFIQSQIAQTRDGLGNSFEPLRKANQSYAAFTEAAYDPVKASVVGRVAGARGFDPSKEAATGRLTALFEKGTNPGAKTSEILTLEKALRNQPNGPESFQDAVKTWMSTKVSEATARKGGRPAEETAANLEKIFTGNDVKNQGFKDMLVGLARSQQLPDDALLPGMQNVMKIVSAAARRPGSVGGTSRQELDEASRSKLFGSIGNFSAIQPIRQPFKALDDWLNADAYSFMDKLLTSPEGVDTLIKLGKQPVMSKAAADTLTTFLSTASTANSPKPESGTR